MLVDTWHFSFTVSDIEQSIRFYRDVVGLELVHTQEQANPYTCKLVGYPDAHLKVAMFRIADAHVGRSGHMLELIEYVAPRGEKLGTMTKNTGAAHLAFEVDDIFAEYERMAALGVRFRSSKPVAIEAGRNNGGFTVYFLDPDNITLRSPSRRLGRWGEEDASMIRNDLRAEPVRRLVVMGESNAYGMCASEPANEWVQVLANGIRRFQAEPVRVFNNAIPANVISPDAPGYEQGRFGTWPSAIERFERDMIAYKPDMAVYAYGLNDSRCGHAVESFMAAYRTIVGRTREALPDALIVLVGPYWNLQYDAEMWATPKYRNWIFGKFDRAGDDLVTAYNREIAALAEEFGGLFVDVYSHAGRRHVAHQRGRLPLQ